MWLWDQSLVCLAFVYVYVLKTNKNILKTKSIRYECITISANSMFGLKVSDEL